MSMTDLTITNNRTALMLLLVILISGVMAYQKMPKDYDPGFIIRTAQVVTHFPGASPSRVEQLVTDKLEKVIQEIPELHYVNSESRTGISIITVNISESYKTMRPIWDNLRRKVDSVKNDLPEEAGEPIVNDEFGDVYGIVVGLTGEGYSEAELKEIANTTRDSLLHLSEAAKVEIFGEQEERIFVEYNNARLAELGLSPSQLGEQLSSRNIVIPGGFILVGDEKITLEPSGNYNSVEDIRKTIIQIPGSSQVHYLSDIATVTRGYADPRQSSVKVSGQRGLSIAISMRQGGNNIVLGQQVKQALAILTEAYPIGVEFELISFMPLEVESKVDDFVGNLLQSVIVVTLVMLVTLGLRSGLIVATLIPFSMIFAIWVMSWFNIGIDQISLAALIIALGMLVDNGIVMSESIMVQVSQGKNKVQAAIDAAKELKISLLTSSLTTAAAFLPIFLAESTTGEYTASLFKVVSITLLCSWLLSLTIIPMLCVLFMRPEKHQQNFQQGFYLTYRRLLEKLLAYPWLTLLATLLAFLIAMAGLKLVPKVFFPPSDRSYFKIELELPMGSKIAAMENRVSQIEAFMEQELRVDGRQNPEHTRSEGVVNWVAYLASAGPRFLLTHQPKPSSDNYALLVVNVTSPRIIDEVMRKIDRYTFDQFPDLLVKLRKIENGAPIANPVEIRLSARDDQQLFNLVDQVKSKLGEIEGLKSISDNWGLPIKKLEVKINQANARRTGISSKDIAISLQTGLSGLTLSQYREDDEIIPIMMRSLADQRQDISQLESLAVYSQSSGVSVSLKQVADIGVVWEPSNIMRRDRLRTVTIGAQVDGINAQAAFSQIKPWLDQQQASWPFGYHYEFGGEVETSEKANISIKEKLPIAILIILLLLVGQFNSLRKALIILTSIPLGMVGVVAALLLGHSYFGFITLLGIISLAGIVVNNAIVLLERIQFELDHGQTPPIQSVITAAQQRLRPILLTTATTVCGLLPLYFGGGKFWEPMALAIMGGLLFSTLLTLGVVPVLYALLYGIKNDNQASGSPVRETI